MATDQADSPNGRWLWDQPKAWHEVNAALNDIAVLLEYIGKLPDARMLSYFDDTRTIIATGVPKTALPPIECYAAFLTLLSAIATAFESGDESRLPAIPARSDQCPPLTPVGFVHWSRDFLASVAAPATADSIRLTHGFVIMRARWWGWLNQLFGRREDLPRIRKNATAMPAMPYDPREADHRVTAGRLAGVTRRYEVATIVMVGVTVLISVYALTGRLILNNLSGSQNAWLTLDSSIEQYEEKIFPPTALPVKESSSQTVVHLCHLTHDGPAGPDKPIDAVAVQVADNGPDAVDAVPATPKTIRYFVAPHQAHLCEQREKALLDLFVNTLHLQSWSSVVAWKSHGTAILAPLFGIRSASLTEYAKEREGHLCDALSGFNANTRNADRIHECERTLWTYILRSRNVADSILGSITEFILPMCYGFLGAMAAAYRTIRRKVDAAVLSSTDRVLLTHSAILGVLCGGVIGLFAGYIGKDDAASSLGLSALALLAGYNIDGVFRLLDELSDRMFRAGPVAK